MSMRMPSLRSKKRQVSEVSTGSTAASSSLNATPASKLAKAIVGDDGDVVTFTTSPPLTRPTPELSSETTTVTATLASEPSAETEASTWSPSAITETASFASTTMEAAESSQNHNGDNSMDNAVENETTVTITTTRTAPILMKTAMSSRDDNHHDENNYENNNGSGIGEVIDDENSPQSSSNEQDTKHTAEATAAATQIKARKSKSTTTKICIARKSSTKPKKDPPKKKTQRTKPNLSAETLESPKKQTVIKPPKIPKLPKERMEFTAQQKLHILSELDSENPPSIKALLQKYGVSKSSFHRWKRPEKRERLMEMVGHGQDIVAAAYGEDAIIAHSSGVSCREVDRMGDSNDNVAGNASAWKVGGAIGNVFANQGQRMRDFNDKLIKLETAEILY